MPALALLLGKERGWQMFYTQTLKILSWSLGWEQRGKSLKENKKKKYNGKLEKKIYIYSLI